MPVDYRNMLPEDEDAAFNLRLQTWGAPSLEYVRQGAYLDPLYLQHTFVAVEQDGTLLSTVRYWPREIRDVGGVPRLVGCVASVITVESARRQGHARKLMQKAIEAMGTEGCSWTLLFSSEMGVPLYESLGYRLYSAPYYRGLLSGRLPDSGAYAVQRFDPPFDIGADTWRDVRDIYAAYNTRRPLSLLRDDGYWRGYFARRLSTMLSWYAAALFVARTGSGRAGGYLLARISRQEPAGEQVSPDEIFSVTEVGTMPGHDGALPALLSAAIDWVNQATQGHGEGRVGGAALLPREKRTEEAMQTMFGQSLHDADDRRMMALPIGEGFREEDIAAGFAAPGALFSAMDNF